MVEEIPKPRPAPAAFFGYLNGEAGKILPQFEAAQLRGDVDFIQQLRDDARITALLLTCLELGIGVGPDTEGEKPKITPEPEKNEGLFGTMPQTGRYIRGFGDFDDFDPDLEER